MSPDELYLHDRALAVSRGEERILPVSKQVAEIRSSTPVCALFFQAAVAFQAKSEELAWKLFHDAVECSRGPKLGQKS